MRYLPSLHSSSLSFHSSAVLPARPWRHGTWSPGCPGSWWWGRISSAAEWGSPAHSPPCTVHGNICLLCSSLWLSSTMPTLHTVTEQLSVLVSDQFQVWSDNSRHEQYCACFEINLLVSTMYVSSTIKNLIYGRYCLWSYDLTLV